jgi:predicted component of type VI protein secretion system
MESVIPARYCMPASNATTTPTNKLCITMYPSGCPIGSSPEDGLRLTAPKVKPHHAELLFRDGMYWIQNLAEPGSVRVGCHGLATNEVLALAAGDMLRIGSAQFTL